MSRALIPVIEKKFKDLYSMAAIQNRFGLVIEDYCKMNLLTRRALALEWGLNDQHLSAVINGHKDVTLPMLLGAIQYGNVNINYVMGGQGPMFLVAKKKAGSKVLKKV